MPNRYEREIEEILRNLEHPEPNNSPGQKSRERSRRKPDPGTRMSARPPSPQRSLSFNFKRQEWFLIIAVVTAVIAGGYAYVQEANLITGLLALVGIVSLILLVLSSFLFSSRPSTPPSRYGNGKVTPLRRTPLSGLRTRWNLFLLKMRYRRKKE